MRGEVRRASEEWMSVSACALGEANPRSRLYTRTNISVFIPPLCTHASYPDGEGGGKKEAERVYNNGREGGEEEPSAQARDSSQYGEEAHRHSSPVVAVTETGCAHSDSFQWDVKEFVCFFVCEEITTVYADSPCKGRESWEHGEGAAPLPAPAR